MPTPDASAAVHRLTEMTVEEVSLVDKAANRRKWLIVKRDGTMSVGAQIKPAGNGNFTAAPPPAEKAAPPMPPAPGGPPAPAAPAEAPAAPTVALLADDKALLTQVVGDITARLSKVTAMVNASTVAATPDASTPEPILDVLSDCLDMMEDLAMTLAGVDGVDEEKSQPTEEEKAAGATPPPDGPSLRERFDVRRAKRLIAKSAGGEVVRSVLVKYGAKMSKKRKDKFVAAMKLLSDLLGELEPTTTLKTKPATTPAPAAESLPTHQAPVEKRDPEKDALLETVNELKALAKSQGALLAGLQQRTMPSNSIPVSSPGAPTADAVSWPLDINQKLPPGGDPACTCSCRTPIGDCPDDHHRRDR